MTTIYDIAVAAKVSTATVSRVINTPELVSEKTRAKVEEAIEKLHYAPNALARELVTKSTNLIGLLIPDIANSFSPAVVDSFVGEMERNGYNIFVSITDADPEKENKCIDIMLKKRVEGIVLLGTRRMDRLANERIGILARRIPIVAIDYMPGAEGVCCVRCDEILGAFYATEYLIQLGHKRIALLNGNEEYTTYYYKRKGYRQAMEKYGLPVREEYCIATTPYFRGGYEACMQFLSLPEPPTAMFISGDQMAVGAYNAILSSGLKIPDDMSVVGFSGSPLSKAVYPPLSTVSQYARETGSAAAGIMLQKLRREETKERVVFQPTLVKRASCGPVKQ